MNLNKVLIAGRLTADPELRTTPAGDHVASFSIATNRFWRTKEGERKENTEFHNVVVWGRQAEIANQFCKKGSIILIEGRLQTRAWEGKDGQTRRTTEIIAENIQFGPRSSVPGDVKSKETGREKEPKEDIPVIDLDAGDSGGDQDKGDREIKPEDLPF
ncbi:MAG: hypothetical protein A2Y84_01860 [Candidatus Colwellbacteria bacterium RBG_13_48_8]|uniref:Single-stranded DNA-binding protein n=1 Tax=Candidatus Colwellbacteria bacterium RBG_13_48_8 TaxID=1797685 RepID=A0A1G1YXM0_9BACT|nr:MAG: hypothetical protein A2Y84_01860 [Candidatus Colwellbacteria bacterium RBG_13_48_8]